MKFHDGAPFTADDAVFSIERALAKTSQRASQLRGVTGVRKVDALTIDVQLSAPDAVLPDKLWLIAMMSKAWAEKHGVMLPQDYNGKQETYAVRNANGTGPFVLKTYEQDRRLVLTANPNWWGKSGKGIGNVTEAIYTVIQADATRLAALASNEVDFVIDPPFQDVARIKRDKSLKAVETSDIGMQYLGFDQSRSELQSSDVKGRNPFKDLRVRRAVYHAIDIDTIIAKVLRGQATPIGTHVSPLVDGYLPELDKRLRYDPAAARALLKEAGYARRLRSGARLRQRHLPRGGVPGDQRDAGASRHPRFVSAIAELDLLSEADAGDIELLRIRLDAGHRPVGDAQQRHSQLGRRGQRRVQRRPLFEPEARCADRRDSRRARHCKAPRADRRRTAHHEHRPAAGPAVSAQADVGDAAEHRCRAVAQRCA